MSSPFQFVGKICKETEPFAATVVEAALKTRSLSPKRLRRGSPSAPEPLIFGTAIFFGTDGMQRNAHRLLSIGSIAACGNAHAAPYNGMIRVCCATGISTMLLEDLDSTKRLAMIKSASENAATNDAHAN